MTDLRSIQSDLPSASSSRRSIRLVRRGEGFYPAPALTPIPSIGPREVLLRVKAASLNYRDLLILDGRYGGIEDGRVPFSDAAGAVLATGSEVSRWKQGDRVMPIFFQRWLSGFYRSAYGPSALGGEREGVLAELIAVPEEALVAVPAHLSFEEAATLPCAAVTAWHALFERGRRLQAGDTLLVQGTGGVALFGLQFAVAVGARAIVISSSDAKLERARALGAWATINYRERPAWDLEIKRLTQGEGVQHILELGGPQTFERSLNSLAAGGQIAQIGVLTGFGGQPNLAPLQRLNGSIVGIAVGSAEHFGALNEFLVAHRLRPVIDRVFELEAVEEAYAYLESGRHFGKLVIRL